MLDLIIIGSNQIEKHYKYESQYKPFSTFWGLGIEEEVYLESEFKIYIKEKEFLQNHKKERYSVDYYSNYKQDILVEAFEKVISLMGSHVLYIPNLINSHTFTKADIHGNHQTLYTTKREPNPDFNGQTLIEFLESQDDYFNQKNPAWIFDGDTIEFISVNFYNSTLKNILNELELNKKIFITKLNKLFESHGIYQQFGKISIMEKNYPFAKYLTNQNNLSMFNNGTIHLNITLPTKLNEDAKIKNKQKFILKHKNAIKLIQWLEPIILAVYGSPDPFATLSGYKDKNKFSNCSQRNVISRYISIGTYDTDLMDSGKILTLPINELPMNKLDYWWFNRFHKTSGYTKLDNIGLDINFNKHWNHGIEIRFLDYISDNKLVQECFEFIIYLIDYSLEFPEKIINIPNPIINKEWNNLTYNIFVDGINYLLPDNDIKIFEDLFDIKIKSINIIDVYYEIYAKLKNKFNKEFIEINKNNKLIVPSGKFSHLVLENKFIEQNIIINNEQEINSTIFNPLNNNNQVLQIETTQTNNNINKINTNNCCIIS